MSILERILQERRNARRNTPYSGFIKQDNDFGDVLYIVHNRQRAVQLQSAIFEELRQCRSGGAIVPPKILPYKQAFIELACAYQFGDGRYDPDDMTAFSQSWLLFLMLDIAETVINENNGVQRPYSTPEKRRRNFAQSLGSFIGSVVMYRREQQLQELCNNQNQLQEEMNADHTIQFFINGYQEYLEREIAWWQDNQNSRKFYHPLSAYSALARKVEEEGFRATHSRIVFVEDVNLMEPIFKTIVEKLQCIQVDPKPDAPQQNHHPCTRKFFAFASLYDEAESVAASIVRDIACGRILPHRIAVVPCNRDLADAIQLTFSRWGLASGRPRYIGESQEFRLLYTYYLIKTEQFAGSFDQIMHLFESPASALCYGRGAAKIRNRLAKEGRRLLSDPIGTLRMVVKEHNNQNPGALDNAPAVDDIEIALQRLKPDGNLTATDAFRNIVRTRLCLQNGYRPNFALLDTLALMCEEIDTLLPPNGQDPNRPRKVALLMELSARREYCEPDRRYPLIPVVDPEHAPSIVADKIYVCGLDASLDRLELLPGPYCICKRIGLQLPAERKQQLFANVERAIAAAGEAVVSYAYTTTGVRDVAGVSNLYEVLKEKARNNNANQGNGVNDTNGGAFWTYPLLLRADNQLPRHWSYNFAAPGNNVQHQPAAYQYGNATLWQLLAGDAGGGSAADIRVPVKDIACFWQCPRKYLFKLLLDKAKLAELDADDVQRMNEGGFWHAVYARAFREHGDAFNNNDPKQIEQVLQKAYKAQKQQDQRWHTFVGAHEGKLFDARAGALMKSFAQAEAQRRQSGYQTVNVEVEINVQKQLAPYDGAQRTLTIGGRIDRIDTWEGHAVVFDYKKTKRSANMLRGAGDGYTFTDEDRCQVALYGLLYSDGNMNGTGYAQIIGRDGRWRLQNNGWNGLNDPDTILQTAQQVLQDYLGGLDLTIEQLLTRRDAKCDPCSMNNYCYFKNVCKHFKNGGYGNGN